MRLSLTLPTLLLAGSLAAPTLAPAQESAAAPARVIRRDIPLTNMIRRAFALGTRDSTGRPGRNYWQLGADYTIQARLEPATGELTGRETIVIRNTSDSALRSIRLRLDQNIFAANVARLEQVSEITDGMRIARMAVDGQAVNLSPPPFRGGAATLAAYGLTTTAAFITLPTPIAGGATATLEIEWGFRVARSDAGRGMRMGRWADSLYQVAQWYPRVAVYDDLRGWDAEPYLGPSEFYNNFGRFDVTIDVPAGWVVGATGTLQNPDEVLTAAARERLSRVLEADTVRTIVAASERGPGQATAGAAGARLRWRFVADSVADFAFGTSDRYVWDATRATLPGGARVPVHIIYSQGRARNYAPAGAIVRHALEFYSRLWMPYAFPQFTIIDGPEQGMEYPMIIFSGVGAADHEVGHQWWPMMVGVNETWYGFMDEGFNQYMNILSGAARRNQPPSLNGQGQSYGLLSGSEAEAPLMWNANYGGPMYGFQAYGKAPMMLSMLGGIVGDSAVWRAMSAYAQAWAFKHPSPWDYAFFMNRELGRDLSWFWYYWLFTTDAVHGSIVTSRTSGSRTTVTVRQDGEMPAPVVLRVKFAATGPAIRPMPGAVMLDSVTALVTWPVDVWFAGRRTYDAVLSFGSRAIERITLDPNCRFPDRDVTDNMWPRDAAFAQQARERASRNQPPPCYGG
jgi:hypothetical protein